MGHVKNKKLNVKQISPKYKNAGDEFLKHGIRLRDRCAFLINRHLIPNMNRYQMCSYPSCFLK